MSKRSKKEAQAKRRAEKFKAKLLKKMRYEQEAGRTKASKVSSSKRTEVRMQRHAEGPCNNIGCKRSDCQAHQAHNWRIRLKNRETA